MKLLTIRYEHQHYYHPDERTAEHNRWVAGMLSTILEKLESIMTVSAEVQTALDAVRQTKSLVQSVDAGIKVNNTLITDLKAQIAALPAGQVLSEDDKAALAETASTLADVNTQLASDIPAGVTQP